MSSVTKVKGGFDDKIKALVKRSSTEVAEVGWFASDGAHPTANMSYPRLAKFHATGEDGVPVRNVLAVAEDKFSPKKYQEIRTAIGKYLVQGTDQAYEEVIEALGEGFWKECHDVIGNPSRLPVTNNPTPLVDTGELEDHLSYRTSKNPTLKR